MSILRPRPGWTALDELVNSILRWLSRVETPEPSTLDLKEITMAGTVKLTLKRKPLKKADPTVTPLIVCTLDQDPTEHVVSDLKLVPADPAVEGSTDTLVGEFDATEAETITHWSRNLNEFKRAADSPKRNKLVADLVPVPETPEESDVEFQTETFDDATPATQPTP